MKRKLLNLAFLLFLGTCWLYPCTIEPQQWGYIAACFVSYLCITLIPQRTAALIAAAAVSLGMGVFFRAYFYIFAPAVFACAALSAALSGKKEQPLFKDVILICSLAASLICTLISLFNLLIAQKTIAFIPLTFERYYVYVLFFAVFITILLIDALRRLIKNHRKGEKTKTHLYLKLACVYVTMLAAFSAAAVCCLKGTSDGKISLLPVLLGTWAAAVHGTEVHFAKTE